MYAFVTACNSEKRTKNDNATLNIYCSHLVALSKFKLFVISYSALRKVSILFDAKHCIKAMGKILAFKNNPIEVNLLHFFRAS